MSGDGARTVIENPGLRVVVQKFEGQDGQRLVGLQLQAVDGGQTVTTFLFTATAALNVARDLSAGILWAMGIDTIEDQARPFPGHGPLPQ